MAHTRRPIRRKPDCVRERLPCIAHLPLKETMSFCLDCQCLSSLQRYCLCRLQAKRRLMLVCLQIDIQIKFQTALAANSMRAHWQERSFSSPSESSFLSAPNLHACAEKAHLGSLSDSPAGSFGWNQFSQVEKEVRSSASAISSKPVS